MRTSEELRQERDDLDETLGDLANLIAALQLISWEFCGLSIERNDQMSSLRGALVGVSDALDERVNRAMNRNASAIAELREG